MRRRTALGVGAVLAGTVVFGAGGTVAALSDTASISAEAGAGALNLEVGPTTAGPLKPDRPLDIPLRVEATEGAAVALRMSVAGEAGPGACAGLPAAAIVVEIPSRLAPRAYEPCELEQALSLITLDRTDTAVDLTLRLAVTPRVDGRGSASWAGAVRLSLLQVPGGFSDHQDVEVHVVTPPGQGGGDPGNGRSNRRTSTAATVPAPQVAVESTPDEQESSSTSPEAGTTADSAAVVDEPMTPGDADAGVVVEQPGVPTDVAGDAGGTESDAAETGAGAGAPDPVAVSVP
jgi:hypothetical protein